MQPPPFLPSYHPTSPRYSVPYTATPSWEPQPAWPGAPVAAVPNAPPSPRTVNQEWILPDEEEPVFGPQEEPGSLAQFKRVEEFWDAATFTWTYTDSTPAKPVPWGLTQDKYNKYCFTYHRKHNSPGGDTEPNPSISLRSHLLVEVCEKIIGKRRDVTWSPGVKVNPLVLLSYLERLKVHLRSLEVEKSKSARTVEEDTTVIHLGLLLNFLETQYASTIQQLSSLYAQGEIMYDLLWAIFLPGTILFSTCPTTDRIIAHKLLWAGRIIQNQSDYWQLECQYFNSTGCAHSETSKKQKFCITVDNILIGEFQHKMPIASLRVYPSAWHPREKEIRTELIERGKKWASLQVMHHRYYNGVAMSPTRVLVNSRVMIDKHTYNRVSGQFPRGYAPQSPGFAPTPVANPSESDNQVDTTTGDITEDELLLTPAVVYGFSLADKLWLSFDVELVQTFEWNDAVYDQLVLPPAQKKLIRALVQSHNNKTANFDDFVKGKGKGLVINLFGPPGIGKTLTAESLSEVVRRPLYVVGSGDLDTNAKQIDPQLTTIFDIAHTWSAIVLIDEADVFLEERSLNDLGRNALVAVFLRQLEYFQGILFLTTNRVNSFDEAFESRIHVSLRFKELDFDARRQIWMNFFKNMGVAVGSQREGGDVTNEELDKLSKRNINGRQIKNAMRTAQALAINEGEKLGYLHFTQVLDVIDQFHQDLQSGRKRF